MVFSRPSGISETPFERISSISARASVIVFPSGCLSVIDAAALRETKTIQVGAGAVSIDSAKDGSRVYVISAHDTTTIADNVDAPGSLQPNRTFATPSVTVINTTGDVPLATPVDPSVVSAPSPTFHTPQQDPNCKVAIDSSFNSKVPMPCPLQVPFEVRVFP